MNPTSLLLLMMMLLIVILLILLMLLVVGEHLSWRDLALNLSCLCLHMHHVLLLMLLMLLMLKHQLLLMLSLSRHVTVCGVSLVVGRGLAVQHLANAREQIIDTFNSGGLGHAISSMVHRPGVVAAPTRVHLHQGRTKVRGRGRTDAANLHGGLRRIHDCLRLDQLVVRLARLEMPCVGALSRRGV